MFFKSGIVGVITLIGAALQVGLFLVSTSLAQSTFDKVLSQETEADWCLYIIWLAWLATIPCLALAVAVTVLAFMDD